MFSQDPAMSGMLESLTNPAKKNQLQEHMARVKDDPSLKPILDEIENGGPAAMMRFYLFMGSLNLFFLWIYNFWFGMLLCLTEYDSYKQNLVLGVWEGVLWLYLLSCLTNMFGDSSTCSF